MRLPALNPGPGPAPPAAVTSKEGELETLVRARYPLIYIVAWEERRVEALLHSIAARRDKRLFVWTCTEGVQADDGAGTLVPADPAARDPLQALDFVQNCREAAIFLLKDFHPYIDDSRSAPGTHVATRKLRDLARVLKESHKTLVLLSPVLRFPLELEKDITVVNFGLPSLDELDQSLSLVINSVEKRSALRLGLDPATREQVLKAAQGLTQAEAENAFARSLIMTRRLDVDVVVAEKEQLIRRSRILEYYHSPAAFEDVGGLDELKIWLRKRALAFSASARAFGLPEPRGILLMGVQGGGKSLVAKAVASLWQLPLLKLDLGKVFSELVGSSEENMRSALATAESIAPAILWLDELDKGLAGVASSHRSDAGTAARVFGSFLTWMQEKTSTVFVIATANNVGSLPPEALRKGRFDEIFFIDLPNEQERREIFAIHIVKRQRDPELYDLDRLAAASAGLSGAEIEQAVISGLYDAFDSGHELTGDDILRAMHGSIPLSQTMREEVGALRDWARTRARPASRR
ncbi:MAG TPA: AAA family ATPase [Chloroflexia bacterium]|nr:AAA family ATPase [Chloroflexia bacterium]